MAFLRDAWDHGRRAAVDALETVGINHSSPWSPEVPDELRSFMPDLVSLINENLIGTLFIDTD